MKNIICSLLYFSLAPALCAAQELGADFGVITKEEIELKKCPFDKEAHAVVLFDKAVSDYDSDQRLITNRHVRIKILDESGYNNADITIYFYRKYDFEAIQNLQTAITNINADGTTTKEEVDKKSIYTKDENERIGKIIFTFPNVKAGSIIEYKYQSVMQHYRGLRDWYFQEYIPVMKSSYTLNVEPHIEFAYRVKKQTELPITIKAEKNAARIFFEMNNVPALGDEEYMDSREDVLQRVEFQLSAYLDSDGFGKKNFMTRWDEVYKQLQADEDFGLVIGTNIAGTKDFIDGVKNMRSEKEKMNAVFNYVHGNVAWNGLTGKYARNGLKEVWNKKKGSEGEINLLLVTLLKDAGLEAYPVLVSERYHGKVDAAYPFIDQFNTVYANVIADGKNYYLNASDKTAPVGTTPKQILNTTAFVINKKKGELINISSEDDIFLLSVNMVSTINDAGVLSGEALLRSEGYCHIEKKNFLTEAGRDKYLNSLYQTDNIKISDYSFANQFNDSLPGEETIKFSMQLSASGDYMHVPLNNFFGFKKNPFITNTRFSDINFGYKRKINTNYTITLPAGYIIEALPKSFTMITPDKDISFSRSVEYSKEDHSVMCSFFIEFKKSLYTYDEYETLYQMYKKIFDFLKEPVVLKKK